MSDKFEIKSMDITFGVKCSEKFQSHLLNASIGLSVDNPDKDQIKEFVKSLTPMLSAAIFGTLITQAKKNPTLAACVEKYKSVGKQFLKYKENIEEDD